MTKPAAGLQSWNIGRTTGALRESHLGWNVKKAIYVQVCFLLSTKRRSRKTAFFLYIFFFAPSIVTQLVCEEPRRESYQIHFIVWYYSTINFSEGKRSTFVSISMLDINLQH